MSSSEHMKQSNRNNLNMRRGNFIFRDKSNIKAHFNQSELSFDQKEKARIEIKEKANTERKNNFIALIFIIISILLLGYIFVVIIYK